MSVIVVPDDWDAWAIWGAKAKELALGTGSLSDVTWFGHADYPLLWPMIWAFSGWISGGWEECLSRGWGTIFLLLCVWEMVNVVKDRTGSLTVGFFSGALFVSMPNVPLITSWSYAEAPLWLMMTCGLSCYLRWCDTGEIFHIVTSALFAAAAAYTKNEGGLYAILLGCLVMTTGSGRVRASGFYFLVFSLCYFPWWSWTRVYLDLGSHAMTGLQAGSESFWRAWHRLPAALQAIGNMWKDIKQWNIVGAGLALALLGIPVFWKQERYWVFSLFLPLGLLLGYIVIILFHPAEIYWQVGTAWNRLTMQTLPLFIVLLVPMIYRRQCRRVTL